MWYPASVLGLPRKEKQDSLSHQLGACWDVKGAGRVAFCELGGQKVVYFGISNKDLKFLEFATRPGLGAQIKWHGLFFLSLKYRTIVDSIKAFPGLFFP